MKLVNGPVVSTRSNPTMAVPLMCIVSKQQTVVGGRWTVFQKRLDGWFDFYRGWDDYKAGFGNLSGEFWLRLDKIHRLTKERSKLRVDLEDFDRNTAYAEYSFFGVGDEESKYNLTVGSYSGRHATMIEVNIQIVSFGTVSLKYVYY